MFSVAPSGSTNPAVLADTPRFSRVTWMLVGSVALLELVENAVIKIVRMARKKHGATGA